MLPPTQFVSSFIFSPPAPVLLRPPESATRTQLEGRAVSPTAVAFWLSARTRPGGGDGGAVCGVLAPPSPQGASVVACSVNLGAARRRLEAKQKPDCGRCGYGIWVEAATWAATAPLRSKIAMPCFFFFVFFLCAAQMLRERRIREYSDPLVKTQPAPLPPPPPHQWGMCALARMCTLLRKSLRSDYIELVMALGHWSEIINKNLEQKNLDDSCVFLGLSTFQTRVTQNPFRIKIKQSKGMQKHRSWLTERQR